MNNVLSNVSDQLKSFQFGFQAVGSSLAILDILLVAIIFYYSYLLIRETRAIRILYGLIFLGLIYTIAIFLNLSALLFLLRSIFAVVLVAIPVVFQPELRAALERIGRTRFIGSGPVSGISSLDELIGSLTTAVTILSSQKIGALIVIEQHDSLREYAISGVSIKGQLTPELLLTIFRPGSALHDGAVIIRGLNIEAASALLPVAGERYDSSIGTRHRAGIGITQETDSVAIIVSEESGKISFANEGKLVRNIKTEQVENKLKKLLF